MVTIKESQNNSLQINGFTLKKCNDCDVLVSVEFRDNGTFDHLEYCSTVPKCKSCGYRNDYNTHQNICSNMIPIVKLRDPEFLRQNCTCGYVNTSRFEGSLENIKELSNPFVILAGHFFCNLEIKCKD